MLRVFTNLRIEGIFLGIVVLALFAAVSACTYKTEIRQGNDLLPTHLQEIQVGMTREEVLSLLGTPQTEKLFGEEDSWIYYYRRRSDGFVVSYESLGAEVVFDENDTVKEIIPLKNQE